MSLRSRIESMEDWLDLWAEHPIKGPRLAEKLAYVFELDAEDILDRWRAHRSNWRFLHWLEYGEFFDEFVACHDLSEETTRGVFARGRECDLWGNQERARRSMSHRQLKV